MIPSLIRSALSQRLVVIVIALALCGFGLRESLRLSVDAFPDVTNIQVQIATEPLAAHLRKSSASSRCPWKFR